MQWEDKWYLAYLSPLGFAAIIGLVVGCCYLMIYLPGVIGGIVGYISDDNDVHCPDRLMSYMPVYPRSTQIVENNVDEGDLRGHGLSIYETKSTPAEVLHYFRAKMTCGKFHCSAELGGNVRIYFSIRVHSISDRTLIRTSYQWDCNSQNLW